VGPVITGLSVRARSLSSSTISAADGLAGVPRKHLEQRGCIRPAGAPAHGDIARSPDRLSSVHLIAAFRIAIEEIKKGLPPERRAPAAGQPCGDEASGLD